MTLHHSVRSMAAGRVALTVAAALASAAALGASSGAFAASAGSGSAGTGPLDSTTDCVSVLAQPGRATGQALQSCQAMTGETSPYGVGDYGAGAYRGDRYGFSPAYGPGRG